MPQALPRHLPLALLGAFLLTAPAFPQGTRQELRDRHEDLSADLADLEEAILDDLDEAQDLLDEASIDIRESRFRAAASSLDEADELIDDLMFRASGSLLSRRTYSAEGLRGAERKPTDPILTDTSWTWAETKERFDRLASAPLGAPSFRLSQSQRTQLGTAIEELTIEAARLLYLGRTDAALGILRRIHQRQALLDGVSPYSPYFAYLSGGPQTHFRLQDFLENGVTRTAQGRASDIDLLEELLDDLENGH